MATTKLSHARLFAFFSVAILAAFTLAGSLSPQATSASSPPGQPGVPSIDGNENLPPGATIETLLPGMNLPIAMVFDPLGRLFYTEKVSGNVRLFENGVLNPTPVINFSVTGSGEQGLLGITIDPNFTVNRYLYVFYTCNCTPRVNRVVRFEENNGVGTNPVTIFESPNGTDASNHNGGNIHFDNNGKLYVSLGDDGNTPSNSQDVTVKQGKIHRLNADGTIPTDNPVFTQTGALPSLYAMGLRNSFDFTVDPLTPPNGPFYRIFASENGPNCDDEMNRIEAGYNYGWRPSYPCDDQNPSPTYNTIRPLWYLGTGGGGGCCLAPTGIEVYTGTQILEWQGDIFMASYNNQSLRHMYLNPDRTTLTTVNVVNVTNGVPVQVGMDIETGPDGALWYIEGGGYIAGTLKRIVRPATTPTLPPATSTRTATSIPTSTSTTTPAGATPPTITTGPTNSPTRTSTVGPTNTTGPTNTATRTSTAGPTNTTGPTNTAGPTDTVGPTNTAGPTNTVGATETGVPPTNTTQPTPTVCPIQFSDVDENNTFYTSIRCLACRGIVSGYSDGTFRPNVQVTRGQLAKIVSNSAGFSDPVSGQTFTDVPPTNTFYEWIERLTIRGYMTGYVCGGPGEPCINNMPYFRPFANATRGQTAKIVANAAMFTEPPVGQTFEDVPPTHTFYEFIQRLASRNVMGGYVCGGPFEPCVGPENRPYFRPGNDVTRGQSAKIVANAFFPGCQPGVQR